MRIDIIFGVGSDQYGKTVPGEAKDRAIKWATDHLCVLFGGCTMTSGIGFWRDASGQIVQEPSITLSVLAPKHEVTGSIMREVDYIAERIRDICNQMEVLVVESPDTHSRTVKVQL